MGNYSVYSGDTNNENYNNAWYIYGDYMSELNDDEAARQKVIQNYPQYAEFMNYEAPAWAANTLEGVEVAAKMIKKPKSNSEDPQDQNDKDNDNNKKNTDWGQVISSVASIGGQALSDIYKLTDSIKGTSVDASKEAATKTINNSQIGQNQFKTNYDDLSALWGNTSQLQHPDKEDLGYKNGWGMAKSAISSGLQGAAAGASAGWIGSLVSGVMSTGMDLASSFITNNKAKKAAIELGKTTNAAEAQRYGALKSNANMIGKNTQNNIDRAWYAYGGSLDDALSFGMMQQYLDNQKLQIESKENKITSMPNSFQDNQFAHGGHTHGGMFSNNLTYVDEGGTHEQNPYEGVPVGVDAEGIPNLVEEGEYIWNNNFVFSNRLKVPNNMSKKLKLGNKKKGYTFAEAVSYLQKESEERPNDPISKRGLDASLYNLASIQEQLKAAEQQGNKFDFGGDFEKSAPLLLQIAEVAKDELGLQNTGDYSEAENIQRAADNLTPVQWNPVQETLPYEAIDINQYTNPLQAQAQATNRDILNNSGLNRAAANANILANTFNYNTALGNAYITAKKENRENLEKVKTFNKDTQLKNSEGFLKAAQANQANDRLRYEAIKDANILRNKERTEVETAKAENYGNLVSLLDTYNKNSIMKDMIDNNPNLYVDSEGNYKYGNSQNKNNGEGSEEVKNPQEVKNPEYIVEPKVVAKPEEGKVIKPNESKGTSVSKDNASVVQTKQKVDPGLQKTLSKAIKSVKKDDSQEYDDIINNLASNNLELYNVDFVQAAADILNKKGLSRRKKAEYILNQLQQFMELEKQGIM